MNELDLDELRKIAAKLAAHDVARAALVERRDRLIVEARSAGATWHAVQEATGLTPRGVALALKRAEV